MYKNELSVALDDFKLSIGPFAKKKKKLGKALLCYSGKYLSIESGNAKVVMNAEGSWHGRATFAPEILKALAEIPPVADPLVFTYEDGFLRIGTMKISCQWEAESAVFIKNLQQPSLVDLLAMEATMPRVELGSTELGKKIMDARITAGRKIRTALMQLEDLEITEEDIRRLLDEKIARRIVII